MLEGHYGPMRMGGVLVAMNTRLSAREIGFIVRHSGAKALVVALDLSLSMFAPDLPPSRLERAKQKIVDLLRKRDEGFTALIAYAGDAHTVAPLTCGTALGEARDTIASAGKAKSAGEKTPDSAYWMSMLCTLGKFPTEPAIAT